MDRIRNPWSFATRLPVWTAAVVTRLRHLDATDAADGKQTLDGRYLGVDLVSFARVYAARSGSEFVPMFVRLLDATEALRGYSQHPSADALGRAMLEGARAMLEGRPPRYAAVSGFGTRFVDVDFAVMFKEVANGKAPFETQSWQDYWRHWLGGCWPDLFIKKYPCDGCACEFPK